MWLVDAPPREVDVGGRRVPIAWGFRTGVLFDGLLWRDGVDERARVMLGLRLYFGEDGDWRGDPEGYWRAALSFFAGEDGGGTGEAGDGRRLYDFRVDGAVLYAAMWAQYGIDLREAALHWWTFRALMAGLLPEHAFSRRVMLRGLNLAQVEDPAERARLAREKARVRLEGPQVGDVRF